MFVTLEAQQEVVKDGPHEGHRALGPEGCAGPHAPRLAGLWIFGWFQSSGSSATPFLWLVLHGEEARFPADPGNLLCVRDRIQSRLLLREP